jgi:hypothetical protein
VFGNIEVGQHQEVKLPKLSQNLQLRKMLDTFEERGITFCRSRTQRHQAPKISDPKDIRLQTHQAPKISEDSGYKDTAQQFIGYTAATFKTFEVLWSRAEDMEPTNVLNVAAV